MDITKTFDWLNINEFLFGLVISLVVLSWLFFAIGFGMRGEDIRLARLAANKEREKVSQYRKALSALAELDPSLAKAFPETEVDESSWNRPWWLEAYQAELSPISTETLSGLWDDLRAVKVSRGQKERIKGARYHLKMARFNG